MPDFVTLHAWLHPEPADVPPPEPEAPPEPASPEPASPEPASPDEELLADVCSRVRRFRAMLADALDRALADLVREVAVEVIGRELVCAPADLQRIVARALERVAPDLPLAVHVHPSQLELVQLDVPVIADPGLRSDDVRIDLRSGSIDARLGVRIERMLAGLFA